MDVGGELLKRFGIQCPKKIVPTSLPSGKMTERRGEEREKQNTLIFWLRRKPQSIIYTAELTGEHQAS